MISGVLALVFAQLVFSVEAGSWTTHNLSHGGQIRSYHVYTPSSTLTGTMMFLHGVDLDTSQWSLSASGWGVEAASDEFGFVGVVPVGQLSTSGLAFWNIDVPGGVDDISFLHAVLAEVASANSIASSLPQIALGFSNGAGAASLLGCHDSTSLWVAHVGVHVNPSGTYPQTCNTGSWSTVPVWSGVGTTDFFLTTLMPSPEAGVKAQFQALCSGSTWTETAANNTACYEFDSSGSCANAGQFCLYNDMGHDLTTSLAANAWAFLTYESGYTVRGWDAGNGGKGGGKDGTDGGKDGENADWGDKDGSGKDTGGDTLSGGGVPKGGVAASASLAFIFAAFAL